MNTNHNDPDGGDLDEALLTAYALGQLGEDQRAVVEARLAISDKDRRFVENTAMLAEHVFEAARRGPLPQPSSALREAVQQHLDNMEDSQMKTSHDPSPMKELRRGRETGRMLALAVCLMVMGIPLYLVVAGSGERARQHDAMELARMDDSSRPSAEREVAREAKLQEETSQGAKNVKYDAAIYVAADSARPQATLSAFDTTFDQGLTAPPLTSLTILADTSRSGNEQDPVSQWTMTEPTPPPPGPVHDSTSHMASGTVRRSLSESGRLLDASLLPQFVTGPGDQPVGGKSIVVPDSGTVLLGGVKRLGQELRVTGEVSPAPVPQVRDYASRAVTASGSSRIVPNGDGIVLSGGVRVVFHNGQQAYVIDRGAKPSAAGKSALTDFDLDFGPNAPPRAKINRMILAHISGRDSGETWSDEALKENHAAAFGTGTEQYEPIFENPFVTCDGEQAKSTFAIDVDTASYANVRRFINQGRLPPPNAVRIEELVNYFKYDYPLPKGDAPFSVNTEVAQCPWNGDHRLLRIGIKGQEIDRQERGPSNLVFLLDVSGSMRDAAKLPLVKQAMTMLVDQLTEDDRVAIVTYASGTAVKLESTCGSERQEIIQAIESLSAGGSTHGSAGIKLAYEQAERYFVKGGTNRVILATDGDLNVGITDDDELVKLIQEKAKTGVFLTVLGFGTGNLKDAKMEKLADKGNGIYAYIDGVREANKVLVEELSGSLITIAKDVKIQIEFNPAEVQSYRLIGYENRLMAAKDFRDDKKDAGEIGAGHTVTALYEIVPSGGKSTAETDKDATGLKYQRAAKPPLSKKAGSGELLTLWLRYKQPEGTKAAELEFVVKDSDKRFGEASPDLRFASAVAAFGMVLRGSKHCGDTNLSAVEEFAAGAIGDDPGKYRAEFVELVRRAKKILERQ